MPGFTYYLSGITLQDLVQGNPRGGKINQDILASVGLRHLHDIKIAGTDAAVTEVRRDGPDGLAGVVLYVRTQREKFNPDLNETWSLKYAPDKQVWSKAVYGDFWIGYDREHIPSEEDLQRSTLISVTHVVTDDTGTNWLVPTARSPQKQFGTLPVSIAFNEHGNTVEALQKRFEYLWDIATTFHDRLIAGEEFDDAQLLDWTIEVLGCNYRIGRSEQRVLHDAGVTICNYAFFSAVFSVLLGQDVAQIATEEKKTEVSSDPLPSSSNTPLGTEDSNQTIDQASPN